MSVRRTQPEKIKKLKKNICLVIRQQSDIQQCIFMWNRMRGTHKNENPIEKQLAVTTKVFFIFINWNGEKKKEVQNLR